MIKNSNHTKAEKATYLLDNFHIADNFVWRRCSNDWLGTWSVIVGTCCVRITFGIGTTGTATIANDLCDWIRISWILVIGINAVIVNNQAIVIPCFIVTCTG